MVATSLPFWMQHPSRTMSPFPIDAPLRSGPDAPRGLARAGIAVVPPRMGIVIQSCAAPAIERHAAAWQDLAGRAVEPNAFLEPGFALPALRHFAPAHRPRFLLAWDHGEGSRPVLVGLLALQPPRAFGAKAGAAWHHPQWVTSAPLLDRERGAAALDAMLGHLQAAAETRGGLVLRGIAAEGGLMRLLRAGAERRLETLSAQTRAVLPGGPDAGAPALSAKRAKEMRRQRRRLAGDGACVVRSARSVEEVRAATERFLDLEARGWKGARGTALLCDARLATFTRAMTRLMARRGLCRIDTLDVDGETVAAGIVLRSGDKAFFWKTAYDERHRRLSPGKLLAETLGALQRADPAVALTDSCAMQGHPMIDKLWPARMVHLDLLVAGPGGSPAATQHAASRLRLAQRLRQRAKAAVHGLRARMGRA